MSQSAFFKIPPEIWEKVIVQVGRHDLAALALTARETYPVANRLLYRTLELSFCKCSESYYNALARTILNNPELAALTAHLFIDMKVPCRVKTATSVDNFQPTRPWSHFRPYYLLYGMAEDRRSNGPKGQADWNLEAVQTLVNSQLFDILALLYNLEKITLILGHFQQNPGILSSLLSKLPEAVLPTLRFLKVYDASLVSAVSLGLTSSLRVLDLGYVTVDNTELCAVIGRNAGTLEEIRLHWIIEPGQKPLFADYSGITVRNLKTFTSKGPHAFAFAGLKKLLGGASLLEDIRLESQSMPSATVWAQIFSDFTDDTEWKAEQMRTLRFGASTGCTDFWDSVVKFLCRCGSGLTSLYINGTPRGSIGPFPSDLLNYFSNHVQPVLSRLVLMWRGDAGLSPDAAIVLASFAPSLEMFHACLSFPPDLVDGLLHMIAPFPRLRRLHLTFLKKRHPEGDYQAVEHTLIQNETVGLFAQKDSIFQCFLRAAVAQHPELNEVSWSIYDRATFSGEGPKTYVKINRSPSIIKDSEVYANDETDSNPTFTLDDLGAECRKYETMESSRFRCMVGTKKVLLNQKPSWREDMGNPFLESRRICPYAEFSGSQDRPPSRRREL